MAWSINAWSRPRSRAIWRADSASALPLGLGYLGRPRPAQNSSILLGALLDSVENVEDNLTHLEPRCEERVQDIDTMINE